MIDAGFIGLDPKGKPIKGFPPTPSWRTNPGNWNFAYSRPGASLPFALRCSLQEATGRLFIHASETSPDGVPKNIQVLGLQVANYATKERCTSPSKSWEGVIHNERTLTEMFREFVTTPLWEGAERPVTGEEEDGEEVGGGKEEAKEEGSANGVSAVNAVVRTSASTRKSKRNAMLLAASVSTAAVTGVVVVVLGTRYHSRHGRWPTLRECMVVPPSSWFHVPSLSWKK